MEAMDVVSLAFEEAERQDMEIRCTRDERDRVQNVSVIDITSLLTGANTNNAAEKIREIRNEVKDFIVNFKFPGRGQRETPVATPSNLVKIILALPNPGGKYPLLTKFRDYCAQTLVRSIGGDVSLADEIVARNDAFESGAVSRDHPLQSFRTEVSDRVGVGSLESIRKMKLENDELEARTKRYILETERMRKESDIALYQKGLDVLRSIMPNDERARIEHADTEREMARLLRNSLVNQSAAVAAITDGPSRREVTFEMVALERGLNITPVQIQKKRMIIGKQVVAKFRELYGSEPVKHDCLIGGKKVSVNTYYEEHADLIESVLKEEFGL